MFVRMDRGEEGWYHLANSTKQGDKRGEFTYVEARGTSVIDCLLENTKGWDMLEEFKVESRIESDHMPLVSVWKA